MPREWLGVHLRGCRGASRWRRGAWRGVFWAGGILAGQLHLLDAPLELADLSCEVLNFLVFFVDDSVEAFDFGGISIGVCVGVCLSGGIGSGFWGSRSCGLIIRLNHTPLPSKQPSKIYFSRNFCIRPSLEEIIARSGLTIYNIIHCLSSIIAQHLRE